MSDLPPIPLTAVPRSTAAAVVGAALALGVGVGVGMARLSSPSSRATVQAVASGVASRAAPMRLPLRLRRLRDGAPSMLDAAPFVPLDGDVTFVRSDAGPGRE